MIHRMIFAMAILLLSLTHLAAQTIDLAKIERTIAKEPAYKNKPKYCLLVFGPEAKHRAWLALDGDTLYIDRDGNGDLTRPECRVVSEKDRHYERFFKVGDLTLGGKRYADLQVSIQTVKGGLAGVHADMPMFKEFLKAQPDGKLYSVNLEVPFEKPLPDLRDGSPMKGTRHFAGTHDARGVLQFAANREQAPVIHFGGRWTMWPDGQQNLIRGRSEDLTLLLGTPGRGPGTFARICYDNLVPSSAKPHVRIEYAAKPGAKSLVQSYVLDDRC